MVALKTSPADAKSQNHCLYLIFHGVLYGSAFEYASSELCLVEVGLGRPYACVHLSKFLWEELEFAAMWKPHNPTWEALSRKDKGIRGALGHHLSSSEKEEAQGFMESGRVVSLLVGIWGCFWAPPLGLFTPQKRLGTL